MAPRMVLLISEDERKEKGNYACKYDCMLFKGTLGVVYNALSVNVTSGKICSMLY